MRRVRWLAMLLLAPALVACGGGGGGSGTVPVHSPVTPIYRQAVNSSTGQHPCSRQDAVMQCFLPGPPKAPLGQVHQVAAGEDFAWGGPSCASLRAAGKSFGASYLSTDFQKNWPHSLFSDYVRGGCHAVFVWETTSTRATDGPAAGRDDARAALGQYRSYIPSGRVVIYFAIDCDCAGSQVWSYFDGVKSVLGINSTGAYGGYRPISSLFDTHRIRYGWQTYAWSGSALDPRAQLYQYLNDSSVDYDRALAADYGQTPGPSAPKPKPKPRPRGPVCFGPHWQHTATCNRIRGELAQIGVTIHRFEGYIRVSEHNIAAVSHQIAVLTHTRSAKQATLNRENATVKSLTAKLERELQFYGCHKRAKGGCG